jgi:hypothetical protein
MAAAPLRVGLRIPSTRFRRCESASSASRMPCASRGRCSFCQTVSRDPAEITKTKLGTLAIAPTHEEAQAKLARLRDRGVS